MNIYIYWIIGVFIISMVCGFIFIPIILNFCKAKQLYDIPNARNKKGRTHPVPPKPPQAAGSCS